MWLIIILAKGISQTKVGEEMLSAYWKQTKYKGFMAFSKHFQSMHIRVIGNELQIKRWIAGKKGYVPVSDEEARMVSMKVTPYELGVFIKKCLVLWIS